MIERAVDEIYWTTIGGLGFACVVLLVLGVVNLRRAWTRVQRGSSQTDGAGKPEPNLAALREWPPGFREATLADNTPRVSHFRWVFEYCGIVIATSWISRDLDPITEFRERAIFEGLGLGSVAFGELFSGVWRWRKEGRRSLHNLGYLLLFSSLSLGRGVVAWFAGPTMSYRAYLESAAGLWLSAAVFGVALWILWPRQGSLTEGPQP